MSESLSLSAIDPHGNLLPNQRAVIVTLTDPRLRDATLADIGEMDFGDDAPREAAELAAFRREIQVVRWLLAPQKTSLEAFEFLAGFEDQFDRWRDAVLPDFGFTKKGGKPHDGHMALSDFGRLHTAFTPHELLAMRAMARQPRLVLEPNHGDPQLNFAAMVIVMNRAKLSSQTENCLVNELYGPLDPRMLEDKPITGYLPHIIDGPREMKLYMGDDVSQPFSNRLTGHHERRNKVGLSGMNRQRYAVAMAESVHRDKPIDSIRYSILDGDPLLSPSRVPYARFYGVRPRFGVLRPGDLGDGGQFRVAAGGRRAI